MPVILARQWNLTPGVWQLYALVLSARDETTGERLTRREPFTVAP